MRWSDRLLDRVRNPAPPPRVAPVRRSDDDLHLLRAELGMIVPLAGALLILWDELGLPLRWLPLLVVPIVLCVAGHRLHHARVRRRGGRFSAYDDRRMPGD